MEPAQEEEHENMKNLLISTSSSLTDPRGLRRSRAVRSKTHLSTLSSHQGSVVTMVTHKNVQHHPIADKIFETPRSKFKQTGLRLRCCGSGPESSGSV